MTRVGRVGCLSGRPVRLVGAFLAGVGMFLVGAVVVVAQSSEVVVDGDATGVVAVRVPAGDPVTAVAVDGGQVDWQLLGGYVQFYRGSETSGVRLTRSGSDQRKVTVIAGGGVEATRKIRNGAENVDLTFQVLRDGQYFGMKYEYGGGTTRYVHLLYREGAGWSAFDGSSVEISKTAGTWTTVEPVGDVQRYVVDDAAWVGKGSNTEWRNAVENYGLRMKAGSFLNLTAPSSGTNRTSGYGWWVAVDGESEGYCGVIRGTSKSAQLTCSGQQWFGWGETGGDIVLEVFADAQVRVWGLIRHYAGNGSAVTTSIGTGEGLKDYNARIAYNSGTKYWTWFSPASSTATANRVYYSLTPMDLTLGIVGSDAVVSVSKSGEDSTINSLGLSFTDDVWYQTLTGQLLRLLPAEVLVSVDERDEGREGLLVPAIREIPRASGWVGQLFEPLDDDQWATLSLLAVAISTIVAGGMAKAIGGGSSWPSVAVVGIHVFFGAMGVWPTYVMILGILVTVAGTFPIATYWRD